MKSPIGIAALTMFLPALGCAHNSAQTPQASDGFDLDDDKDTVSPRECTPQTTRAAATDGRISTFTDKGHGIDLDGKVIAYPVGEAAAPVVTTSDGTMHVKANVPVTEKAQYVGVVLNFPKCVDASAFTGVRFSIRGEFRGCSMQYATKDVAHEDRYHELLPHATGRRGAYPPQIKLDSSQVTPAAQTISVPFSGTNIPGRPALALDRSKVTGVLWQFTVSPKANIDDGTSACVADLNIDDVSFY